MIDIIKLEFRELSSILKFPYYILEFQTFFCEIDEKYEFIHHLDVFNFQGVPDLIGTRFLDLYPRKTQRDTYIKSQTNIPEIHWKGGETLDQILEVAVIVLNQNQTYIKAVKIVAKNRNILEGTVRDKCTRRIGLIIDEFINLLKDKQKLVDILITKFPSDENKISECLLN